MRLVCGGTVSLFLLASRSSSFTLGFSSSLPKYYLVLRRKNLVCVCVCVCVEGVGGGEELCAQEALEWAN